MDYASSSEIADHLHFLRTTVGVNIRELLYTSRKQT